jgi:DNA-directed RNA polymerase subunit L
MKKGRERFGNLYLVGILFLEVISFGVMIWNSKRLSEMFYFLIIGIVFVIPCLKEIGKVSNRTKKDSKRDRNTSNNDVKTNEVITKLADYKRKECTTQNYKEFNNLLINSIKNGLMNRECVLKLKYEVRHLLGTHVEIYIGDNSKFKFDNDMHEIYVLSKSSHLKEEDYIYLINFLSSNLDLSNVNIVEN